MTSRRGRLSFLSIFTPPSCFNSRPHEEVDVCLCQWPHKADVSTHDLTKRSTRSGGVWYWIAIRFNSRPHEEVDRSMASACLWPEWFQLTTSRRGRQQFLRKKFSFQNHFLCSLHIIYSYYINTIFFSTLFLAKSSFFLVRIL